MAYLGKHGSRLGGNTGQYFLRWLGWDCFILSNDMVLALRDAGLEISREADIEEGPGGHPGQINRWAKKTGLPRAHISRILAMSIGENHSPEALRAVYGRVARAQSAPSPALGRAG